MNKNRLEAFSDGVFAIVITLLILNVKLPDPVSGSTWTMVKSVFPNILSFVFSFIIIGIYWVAHHTMLHYIQKINRTALWLNNLILLMVTFIPFPTSILGKFPFDETAIWLYVINISLVNISGCIFWWYCSGRPELCEILPSPVLRTRIFWIHLLPAFCFNLAALLSYISPYITYSILYLVGAFFIIPNPLYNRVLSED